MSMRTEPVTVNIGPHHPSTHGVFRLRVTFDGEVIVDVEPVFGYLHRGTEKLAEERTYVQFVTLTDRMDYVASMTNNQGFVLAVEKLAGITPSPRGVWLRMIAAELQRIASHLVGMGFFLQDLGAFATPLMYAMRERERILDLFEMLCGARITNSYMRPGGVFMDAPEDFWPAVNRFLDEMPGYVDEYESLISGNEIVLSRTKGVARVELDALINASISGPMLRAAGLAWDLRKKHPYEFYDRVEFDVPLAQESDNWARYIVRIQEMRESVKIVRQCVQQIEPGPIRPKEVPFLVRPPAGEVYSSIEGPKGELGYYIVSDGSIAPYRCKVRAPSYINLTLLKDMLVGWRVADMIVTFGSIDINMGEVDR
ncbi:MAG: NADH-quinone oxidoreductase subunit D [SAR202 cluster bacterium]|nr:NADH-quinone oxidoreductase subunit D [SAR202 cluster bacterium]